MHTHTHTHTVLKVWRSVHFWLHVLKQKIKVRSEILFTLDSVKSDHNLSGHYETSSYWPVIWILDNHVDITNTQRVVSNWKSSRDWSTWCYTVMTLSDLMLTPAQRVDWPAPRWFRPWGGLTKQRHYDAWAPWPNLLWICKYCDSVKITKHNSDVLSSLWFNSRV